MTTDKSREIDAIIACTPDEEVLFTYDLKVTYTLQQIESELLYNPLMRHTIESLYRFGIKKLVERQQKEGTTTKGRIGDQVKIAFRCAVTKKLYYYINDSDGEYNE